MDLTRDLSHYPWPLAPPYSDLPPLPQTRSPDGKSLQNPLAPTSASGTPAALSARYASFAPPIANSARGGFDVHVYFQPADAAETAFARALHERIRHEFPELRIYAVFERPVGPHPVGMFEVNLFTPAQFGAFVAWLVVHRGPLSALIHPNTGRHEWDHTTGATWMGQPYPLQTWMLRKLDEKEAAERAEKAAQTDVSS